MGRRLGFGAAGHGQDGCQDRKRHTGAFSAKHHESHIDSP
jgi:hypothetical protein